MLTDPLFLVMCIGAVTLLGLAKGGFAGVGMVATPMMALIIPPLQAAAIFLPILLVQDVISVWVYRRDWDAWNLKVMMPGAVIGIAVAWVLAAYLSDAVVRLAVGLIGIAFVLNAWFGQMPVEARQPNALSGVFWGGLSGFTSTLVQAGSPPFQVFTAAAAIAETYLRRHQCDLFRRRQSAEDHSLLRARPVLDQDA